MARYQPDMVVACYLGMLQGSNNPLLLLPNLLPGLRAP